jgi:hypothetical protein
MVSILIAIRKHSLRYLFPEGVVEKRGLWGSKPFRESIPRCIASRQVRQKDNASLLAPGLT